MWSSIFRFLKHFISSGIEHRLASGIWIAEPVNLIRVKKNSWISLWKQATTILCSVFTVLEKGITHAVKVNVVLVVQRRGSEHNYLQKHQNCLSGFKTLPVKLKELLSFKICVKVISVCSKPTCNSCINTKLLIFSCWCTYLLWFARDTDWMCICEQFSKNNLFGILSVFLHNFHNISVPSIKEFLNKIMF